MAKIKNLVESCHKHFDANQIVIIEENQEVTLEVEAKDCLTICETLKSNEDFQFEILIDLCGVDYLHYGVDEWATDEATGTGFERGVESLYDKNVQLNASGRFAVVYHLLSVTMNQRIRVRTFVPDDTLMVDSVVGIWNCANWYEREAFDLFGILFKGHPDLRRLLTDYGFIGHPFRKDFPLSGEVEVRYDAKQGRVIYEPVNIVPRVLVPKVIRQDHEEVKESEEPVHG